MGKVGLYVKISILVIGLVIVVVAMRGTTKDKVEAAFQTLGLDQPPTGHRADRPLAKGEALKKLCQTRVHAVRFPDGRSVVEHKNGMKLDWMAEEMGSAQTSGSDYGPGPAGSSSGRTVAYLQIENWFSLHCEFAASPAPPLDEKKDNLEPSNEPVKFVRIDFIDNTHWELYRTGDVLFSVSHPNDRFISPDLETALRELRAIAAFPVDSKVR
ncbi:hypothetical protein BH10BDE1_BH10BDE1_33100 [soil metagenome]